MMLRSIYYPGCSGIKVSAGNLCFVITQYGNFQTVSSAQKTFESIDMNPSAQQGVNWTGNNPQLTPIIILAFTYHPLK